MLTEFLAKTTISRIHLSLRSVTDIELAKNLGAKLFSSTWKLTESVVAKKALQIIVLLLQRRGKTSINF
jgi:hypothetical protein